MAYINQLPRTSHISQIPKLKVCKYFKTNWPVELSLSVGDNEEPVLDESHRTGYYRRSRQTLKHSDEPLKSIYGDLSGRRFINAVKAIELNKDTIPQPIQEALYYFLDDIHGYHEDRDHRYKKLLATVGDKDEEALFQLAEIAYQISCLNRFDKVLDYTDTIDFLNRALTINANHVESLLLLGDALWNQGKISDALVALNQAILVDPEKLSAKLNRLMNGLFWRGVPTDLQQVLDDLRAHEGIASRFLYLSLEASILHEMGQHAESITRYESALKEPAALQWLVPVIRRRLVDLYWTSNEQQKALEHLCKLDYATQYDIFHRFENYESALQAAQSGLDDEQRDKYHKLDWYYRIANAYLCLKEYDQSILSIKKVLDYKQYRPIKYKDYYLYGQALFGQKEYRESLGELENAMGHIEKDGGHVDYNVERSIRLLIAEINMLLHIQDQDRRVKEAIESANGIELKDASSLKAVMNILHFDLLFMDSNRTKAMEREIKSVLKSDIKLRPNTDRLKERLTEATNRNQESILENLRDILSSAFGAGIFNDEMLRELARLELHFDRPIDAMNYLGKQVSQDLIDEILNAVCLHKQGQPKEAIARLNNVKNKKYINRDQLASVLSTQVDFYRDMIVDCDDEDGILKLRDSFDAFIRNEIVRFSSSSNLNRNGRLISLKGRVLYKYKAFSTNTINSILNNYIYFSTPRQLNDPLDIVIEEIHRSKPEYFEHYQVDPNDFGIFSATTINNHSLMWAHYGDEHKGLCIGYRFSSLPETVGWNGIDYCPDYEHVDDALDKGGYVINSLCTKTDVWAYEEEIRLFRYKSNDQRVLYSRCPSGDEIGCEICEMILGYQMTPEAQQTMMSIVRSINDDRKCSGREEIRIFKAIRSQLYKLQLDEVTVSD